MSDPNDSKKKTTTSEEASSFSQKWTKALQAFTKPLLKPLLAISDHAARYPKTYLISIIIFSIGIMFVGISTNFTEETDDDIWTPENSKPVQHGDWVENDSNFPKASRDTIIIVHRNGKNIFGNDDTSLAKESVEHMFEAIDLIRETPGYDELCSKYSKYIHPSTNEKTCQIAGASNFWNDTTSVFEEQGTSDEAVLTTMSSDYYPSGSEVDVDQIIGYNKLDDDTKILNYGESYVFFFLLPPDDEVMAENVEEDILDRILDLQDDWKKRDNGFRVEILAERSFEDEFGRAVTADLPLIPLVFVLMSILCIIIYARRDKVLSRSWLGFGAVATVLLAIMASFGLLFAMGVPFTALTPLLPFIMFGVGLDDAFIISGAYSRTDHRKTPVDRIHDTMVDIGGTILLTTLTSSLAFALGLISSIPAVRFLVMYAFPTIIIDFIFQITFFVAIIVIDQKRIEDNRRDCCFCCTAKDVSEASALDLAGKSEKHFADRMMEKYSNFLLKPAVKWSVIAFFLAILGFFSWRTSELKQFFDFTDVIPTDSYIQTWWDAFQENYEANGIRAGVYFRDVDFSDPSIQDQMDEYVTALAEMPYSGGEPFEFWLRDFRTFIDDENNNVQDLTFEEQIQEFLNDPLYWDSYNEEIVLNEDGVMTASRTWIRLDNVEEENVLETVDALELQRSISADQPVNKGLDDWKFFTFTEDYYIWEFYRVCPDELRTTVVIGVITVSVLALIFIPHWTAVLFVGPLVAVLYIDLLGFIELAGVSVNPVMYICSVMSIGLMVDFVMHVALRYFETTGKSRTKKTKETLETLGASVMVGGISTLVGVLPLALSTSEIFWTTFIIFFGLVFLGLLHGLILLPVLLSMCGPLDSIEEEHEEEEEASSLEETRH